MNIEQIFDKSIPEPNSGCWLWSGAQDNRGYGRVTIKTKHHRTHRLAYEIVNGQIPNGMHVCHKCDVTSCSNPQHLFIGTPSENAIDMIKKNRGGTQKLTSIEINEIKISSLKQTELAKKYGVSQAIISYHKQRVAK